MTVQWFAQFQYLAGSCTLTLQSPLLDPPGILSGVCGCSYKSNGGALCLITFLGPCEWVLTAFWYNIIPAHCEQDNYKIVKVQVCTSIDITLLLYFHISC